MIEGIDVSSNQGKMVWEDSRAAGASFAISRVGYEYIADTQFTANWNMTKAMKYPRGGYWFLRHNRDPLMQADKMLYFLNHDFGEIEPTIDVERDPYATAPVGNSLAKSILAFTAVIDKEISIHMGVGKKCMVYTNLYWDTYVAKYMPAEFYEGRKLWVANYNVYRPSIPRGWTKYEFWQKSAKGNKKGREYGATASTDIDINQYWGNESDFYSEYHIQPLYPIPLNPETLHYRIERMMNVRAGPGTIYATVGSVGTGMEVEAIDVAGNDAWIKIGTDKWVCAVQGKVRNARRI